MMNPSADYARLLDAYSKKAVDFKSGRKRLELEIPVSVFSSYQLDLGTLRLLRVIEAGGSSWDRVLDLGCGYGFIALHLAANGNCREPVGIDRDVLGAEFARRNAEKNDLPQCSFTGGLAYQDVPPGKYSAVVSNIPAKAGESAHRMMLLNAYGLVGIGGEVRVVVVSDLAQRVDGILRTEGVNVTGRREFNGHVVYSYRFESSVPEVPAYVPRRFSLEWEGRTAEMELYEGLPEQEGPCAATTMLASSLSRFAKKAGCRRVVLCDPGQGYLAALTPCICREAGEVSLVSRDALGLKASVANLRSVMGEIRLRTHHSVSYWKEEMGSGYDVFAAALNKNEGVEIACLKIAGACRNNPGAVFLAACSVSRRLRILKALKALGVNAREESDKKGLCVLECAAAR